MRWLTLLVSLPPTPTRHRVGVWRKLKRMGAVKLKGAAWILPETPETIELFQWLVQEIQTSRGEATLMRVDRIDTMTDEQLTALFHRERAAEYQSLMRACREVRAQLDRSTTAHRLRGPDRRRQEGDSLRHPRRRVRASRRGLHVRNAPEALRPQGPAAPDHRRDRARSRSPRRQVLPTRSQRSGPGDQGHGGNATRRRRTARARHGRVRRPL